MRRNRSETRRGRRAALLVLAVLSGGLMAVAPVPVRSGHKHEPTESGHPLRIIAYAVHPIGVIIDTLIFRPANWIVHWEPLRTLFGHED